MSEKIYSIADDTFDGSLNWDKIADAIDVAGDVDWQNKTVNGDSLTITYTGEVTSLDSIIAADYGEIEGSFSSNTVVHDFPFDATSGTESNSPVSVNLSGRIMTQNIQSYNPDTILTKILTKIEAEVYTEGASGTIELYDYTDLQSVDGSSVNIPIEQNYVKYESEWFELTPDHCYRMRINKLDGNNGEWFAISAASLILKFK